MVPSSFGASGDGDAASGVEVVQREGVLLDDLGAGVRLDEVGGATEVLDGDRVPVDLGHLADHGRACGAGGRPRVSAAGGASRLAGSGEAPAGEAPGGEVRDPSRGCAGAGAEVLLGERPGGEEQPADKDRGQRFGDQGDAGPGGGLIELVLGELIVPALRSLGRDRRGPFRGVGFNGLEGGVVMARRGVRHGSSLVAKGVDGPQGCGAVRWVEAEGQPGDHGHGEGQDDGVGGDDGLDADDRES